MAILVGLYHGQNCFGGHLISGSVINDFGRITWAYSPNHGSGGTGRISIETAFDHPQLNDDERLFFDGLIPEGATVTGVLDLVTNTPLGYSVETCNGDFDGVPAGCEDNEASPGVLVTENSFYIEISLELSPELTYGGIESPAVHGIVCGPVGEGTCLSASPCLAPALGCFDDFVTVAPIPAACIQDGDFDHDGDVDLLDFGKFQQIFTGPK